MASTKNCTSLFEPLRDQQVEWRHPGAGVVSFEDGSFGLELLLDEGLKVQVVELPPGHDPDSFLKAEGADAYRRRLEEAPSYMEWLIRQASAENDTRTPEGKAAFLNALLPSLTRLDSAVERTAWLPAIVERGGLDDRAAIGPGNHCRVVDRCQGEAVRRRNYPAEAVDHAVAERHHPMIIGLGHDGVGAVAEHALAAAHLWRRVARRVHRELAARALHRPVDAERAHALRFACAFRVDQHRVGPGFEARRDDPAVGVIEQPGEAAENELVVAEEENAARLFHRGQYSQ